MCKFMSCVSDGHGEVKFFTVEDVVREMSIGNPKSYNWNSHTSICQFHGINSQDEDKWNKWEYNPSTKELEVDSLVTTDDRKSVLHYMSMYFSNKDVAFLQNLYGNNSGSRNSGSGNSGSRNSGSRNSGSGNSGSGNSGDWNSGSGNSGSGNSGDWNSGDWNSGSRNSGSGNSGSGNSGDGVLNSFCSERKYMLFNNPCTKEEYDKIYNLSWSWFEVTKWICGSEMSDTEKANNKYWDTTDGYLKTIEYKETWKKCPKEFIEQVKKLKNFNKKVFREITGLEV